MIIPSGYYHKIIGAFGLLLLIGTGAGLNACTNKCSEGGCENGGVCVEGTCECPPGYSGDRCEKENAPKVITAKKVKLIKIARTNAAGREFDAAEYPDVYVVIRRGLEKVVHTATQLNVKPTQEAELEISNQAFLYPSSEYTIELWDNDKISGGDEDDLVASANFRPWASGNGFPEWLPISFENGRHEVAIKLEYQW